ncbi:MAG: Uma2 family endonuclease [Methylovulum sp.]|nr:MAG: Uma2 family endonuclease [Methylovulum sp.]
MNTVAAIKYYSIEDYLAAEEKAEFKSEYYSGEVYPMAGSTINHNQIIVNICIIVGIAFKKRDYRVFAGDVKLHIPHTESFTYPDILVIKGQPDYWQNRRDIVCNAIVIIEVLSGSTKDYDRAGKFEIYRGLPGLQDYILVSQDKVHVEHFVKQAPNQWLLTEYSALADVLNIAQLGETLALGDIYDKVDLLHE